MFHTTAVHITGRSNGWRHTSAAPWRSSSSTWRCEGAARGATGRRSSQAAAATDSLVASTKAALAPAPEASLIGSADGGGGLVHDSVASAWDVGPGAVDAMWDGGVLMWTWLMGPSSARYRARAPRIRACVRLPIRASAHTRLGIDPLRID